MSELTAQEQFICELIGCCGDDMLNHPVEMHILLCLLKGENVEIQYVSENAKIFDDLRNGFCIVTPATNLMLDRNYYQSLCKKFSSSPIIAEAALKALYEERKIKLFGKGNQ